MDITQHDKAREERESRITWFDSKITELSEHEHQDAQQYEKGSIFSAHSVEVFKLPYVGLFVAFAVVLIAIGFAVL